MTDCLGPYLLGSNDMPENGIYVGDSRELARAIPDESVDLVFTDPPYLREFLWCYGWVAREAERILRPGGFILAMAGGMYLDRIYGMFAETGLVYHWQYNIHLTGQYTGCVWVRGNNKVPIVTRIKSVLAYSKGKSLPRCATLDLVRGSGADKVYHEWGQDGQSTRYYIDCFTHKGDLVLDPFCGGGTTPAMASFLGRRYLAFEIDSAVAEDARERVRDTPLPLFVPESERLTMEQGLLMPRVEMG